MRKKSLLCTLVLAWFTAFAALAEGSEVVSILEENFNAFTEGSETAPASTDISSGYTGKLKTTLTGWSGSKVYEAGGSLKIGDNGYLQTANTDMSANGGNLKITFRVKAIDTTGGAIQLLLNSTYSTTATVYVYDNKWTTMEVIVGGGKDNGYLRIKPYLMASGMLIDSLKIEASEAFIGAPEATQPTQADGTSFTATWKAVAGATSYMLDVYTKNGSTKEYFLQNEVVSGTTKKVENLDASKKYFFAVRAQKNEYVSNYSNEIRVVKIIRSLNTPVAKEATGITDASFTANWEPVNDAEGYEVALYKAETLKKDSMVNMLHDDFSGFKEGTLSVPSYPSNYSLDDYTSVPGWSGSNTVCANGYFGISPYAGQPGYICSPAIDLSKNNGKFKVTMKAACNYYGTYKEDSVKIYIYNGNNEKIDSTTLMVEGRFAEYSFESEKGTGETYIYISYDNKGSYYKFFIDEIAVAQELAAGEVVTSWLGNTDVENVTSYTFEVPFEEGVSYAYYVAAYAPTVGGSTYTGYYITYIYSSNSNKVTVTAPTGINDITGKSGCVKDGAWYTLQGVRLNGKPSHNGIYIFNGKKIAIKNK